MRMYNMPDDENYDAAHEEDMRVLMLQQLRDNISPEEANEELDDDCYDPWIDDQDFCE